MNFRQIEAFRSVCVSGLTRVCEEVGSKPRLVTETPNSATVCALALEGIGVGLVNPLATGGFVERGLVFRPFEPCVAFKSFLLFRPDVQKSADRPRFRVSPVQGKEHQTRADEVKRASPEQMGLVRPGAAAGARVPARS